MRLIDDEDYGSVGEGMWWALQTVTTVGYGDSTPTNVEGRIVAAFVMLEGIAFLSVVTAAITSTFVARATREREAAQAKEQSSDAERIEARLDLLEHKLDSLAAMLRGTGDGRR
jgi:voltage-gated potassium channel